MRYEELPGPLEGWTYDEAGTIHTASGYKCTARTLECALWLLQCYGGEARRYLMHSDEAPGALRPLYESSDADGSGKTQPTRLRLEKQVSVVAKTPWAKTGHEAQRTHKLNRQPDQKRIRRGYAPTPPT